MTGRIDARPQGDPAVQVGLRNIHRDTKGNVIGAVTPEGRRIGTMSNPNRAGTSSEFQASLPAPKNVQPAAQPVASVMPARPAWRGSATPRLDAGPQTPGLDSNPSNLQQRQALFADMKQAGAGGLTPEMSQRAEKLGVDQAGWRRGVAKLSPAPAAIAAAPTPVAAPMASVVPPAAAPSKLTRTPAPMAASPSPLVQQAMAARDIGKMLADRKASETAAAAAMPAAPSFAVPPVASPIPVSSVAPSPSFRALTTPAAPVPAMPPSPASVPANAPSATSWRKTSASVPKMDLPGASAKASFQAREKQVADQRKIKRTAYNKVWNAQPDLPVVARDSVANKVQKSLRTFFSGNSY